VSERPDTLRIAVAQPPARDGEDELVKVDDAVATIAAAGRDGVELLAFPEAYPGPIRAGTGHDAMAAIAAAAAAARCAVCWSRIERGEDGLHRTVAYLHDRCGSVALRYERSHPATGDVHQVLSGVPMAPGEGLALADLGGLRIGILICSELWIPEIARSLAVRGAEVLLAPAGGAFPRVAPNWQLIARARAIENQCHLGLTQALFGNERGAALIAGPETLLAASEEPGLIVADADLERARWLRSADDSMREPKPFDSLPGLLRARRPELYEALSEPGGDLYDYDAAGGPGPGDQVGLPQRESP
jgi:predicted amidohydrolase